MAAVPIPLSQLRAQQPQVVDQLCAAYAAQRLPHAYLLCSTAQEAAWALALGFCQALVCHSARPGTPLQDACGTCGGCAKLASLQHPDVHLLRADAKGSIGVDAVRAVCTRLAMVASESPVKLVVLAPAQALQPAAQNALLKTLEEPPGDSLFLVLGQGRRQLLPTVVSRCQALTLRPTPLPEAVCTLRAAGVEAALASLLAQRCGDQVEAAQLWVEAGAQQALALWQRSCAPQAPLSDVFAAASDLGADASHYQMALELLTLLVRNTLAQRHGLDGALPGLPAHVDVACLEKLAQRLCRLQQDRAHHPNRAMALGELLLLLHGSAAQVA